MVVEFKISMHCNACERSVAKVISKFKGVETFTTNMIEHKATVKGQIDPKKLLKKLKKKTGKRVEIVVNEEDDDDKEESSSSSGEMVALGNYGDCKGLWMFSDENPNACFVM